jgi:hypothetical protein
MDVRRCLACKNLVARESIACPICGKTYKQVITARIIGWILTGGLFIWLAYFFVLSKHALSHS